MDLLVGPGGGIPSHLQSWSSLWMMQEGIHLHSEIPFSAGFRRQIAALGVPESSRCGAEGDRQGSSWIRPVGKLGRSAAWMEALEVLSCALFVVDSAAELRFYRNQSSSCRLRLSNCRSLFERTRLVIGVWPRVSSSGRWLSIVVVCCVVREMKVHCCVVREMKVRGDFRAMTTRAPETFIRTPT